jgi:uncharacterized membrane protein YoaK (UPF0700 family)
VEAWWLEAVGESKSGTEGAGEPSISSERGGVPLSAETAMPRPALRPLQIQTRLAISLAWVAGFVNAVGVLTCGTVTSHVTGHASGLGRDAALGEWGAATLMGALVGAFFLGAFATGLSLEVGRARGWPSLYAIPAAIEVVLLGAFAVGVRWHDPSAIESGATLWWMTGVASCAMGVQNAIITRISSGVVRTTHLTGIVTDLGHELAHVAVRRGLLGRAYRDPGGTPRFGTGWPRLALLASIVAAFVFGSACGAWTHLRAPQASMLPPILLLGWIILVDLRTAGAREVSAR